MRVPPLVLLVAAVALSAGIASVDPLRRSSGGLVALGALLGLVAVGIAVAGVAAFRRQRTTVDPRYPERATALVASSVYRWTRNPMYLGFVGVALGAAVGLGSPLALAGPVLLAAYLDRVQIPAEEQALRARFGAEFDAYTRSVRRWIGTR